MDWIKKNYDQAALLLLALILLGMSAKLIMDAMSFNETFKGLEDKAPRNDKVPPPDTALLERANAELNKTPNWNAKKGSLFVSPPYISQGTPPILINPYSEESPPLHPPIPNKWFVDNNLEILNPNILNEDADGDNFTNLEEYNSKTNPQDKDSHPPFAAKLRLLRFVQVPFKLTFKSYDGDVKKPETLTFQINSTERSQFGLKVGDTIAGKKPFKITKFEFKEANNPSTGTTEDASELTVEDVATHQRIVLVLNKEANSPDSYAVFRYLINNRDYSVKLDASFELPPDNKKYKLVDVNQSGAVIQDEQGNKLPISKLQP